MVLISLCFTGQVFAAQPLTTDDAGTVGALRLQVESSLELAWDKQGKSKSACQTLGMAITTGIAAPLDLVLAIPYSWQSATASGSSANNNSGINDISMALKWRFLEAASASMAIKPSVSFPTGNYDRGLGAGRPSFGVTLISSFELKPAAFHANIGYTHQKYTDADKDLNRENLFNLSLAATLGLTPDFQLAAEIGAATNPDRANSAWPLFITGGVVYAVSEGLDLDLGIKGGLNGPETDITLLAGVTAKF